MQINFTGHHLDITPTLREYATTKLAKLSRHFDRIISIHVTFDVQNLTQVAEATIFLSKAELHASSESENMYAAIDQLAEKLDRQLKKHKEKIQDHRE